MKSNIHEKYKPFIFQQSVVSCCLVSSFLSLNEYLYQKEGGLPTKFSVLYLYSMSKIKELELFESEEIKEIDLDKGLHLNSLLKSAIESGIAQQRICNSNIEELKINFVPTPEIVETALGHRSDFNIVYLSTASVTSSTAIEIIEKIKFYIDREYPIVALISFDDQIYINMCSKQCLSVKGRNCYINHAILITGYTETYFIFQNSFGEEWGYSGFGHIKFDILTKTHCLYTIDKCIF